MIKNKLLFSLLFLTVTFNFNTIKVKANEIPQSTGVWNVIEHGFPQAPLHPKLPEPEWKIHHTRAKEVDEGTEELLHHNRWNVKLSPDEKELLAKIVFLEAGNQGLVGQEYVAVVILNRMISENFPSTVYEVLSQENPVQFTSWKNRNISTPTEETYKAIENILNGTASEYISNAYFHYFSRGKGSSKAVKIGDHWFW